MPTPLPIPSYLQTPPPRDLTDPDLAQLVLHSKRGTWVGGVLVIIVAMAALAWMLLSLEYLDMGAFWFTMSCMFVLSLVLPVVVTRSRRRLIAELLRAGTVYPGYITQYRHGSQYIVTRVFFEYDCGDGLVHKGMIALPAVRGTFSKDTPILVLAAEAFPGRLLMIAQAGGKKLQGFMGQTYVKKPIY